MWVFREPEEPDYGREALTFALGALGGLTLGVILWRALGTARAGRVGQDVRDRARRVAGRMRPSRLRRHATEQNELTSLEDAVLDAFLADAVLGGRGIDIGAVSAGIIELSGSVWTEEEVERAVRTAHAVPGVRTVVNRLETEDELRRVDRTRRGLEDAAEASAGFGKTGARGGGMGRRRQSLETDPDRNDDSQSMRLDELADADEDQWIAEGYADVGPKKSDRPAAGKRGGTRYDEDELDNQDPHGKHAGRTLDEQPQELNTAARVGEGLEPGTRLRLEGADLPVKPRTSG